MARRRARHRPATRPPDLRPLGRMAERGGQPASRGIRQRLGLYPDVIRTPANGVGVGFSGIGNADRLKRHESGGRTMAHVADHLSVSALEQQYRSCTDVTAARHLQTIWLLAKGHDLAQVAATVWFARRWVERLLARYNAQGPQALGDLRRRNGTSPSVLRPDLLEKLKARLLEPPPDGGLWTSPKVAAWMAGELGLAAVLPQRGWEGLKGIHWSVQKPRPRHPASATPEEREAFKKSWGRPSLRREPSTRTRRSRSGPRTSTALA